MIELTRPNMDTTILYTAYSELQTTNSPETYISTISFTKIQLTILYVYSELLLSKLFLYLIM